LVSLLAHNCISSWFVFPSNFYQGQCVLFRLHFIFSKTNVYCFVFTSNIFTKANMYCFVFTSFFSRTNVYCLVFTWNIFTKANVYCLVLTSFFYQGQCVLFRLPFNFLPKPMCISRLPFNVLPNPMCNVSSLFQIFTKANVYCLVFISNFYQSQCVLSRLHFMFLPGPMCIVVDATYSYFCC